MKYRILIILSILNYTTIFAQFQTQHKIGDGLPNPYQPKVLRIDTLVKRDSCKVRDTDHYNFCSFEYILEYHYSDLTNKKIFWNSSGQKISNKKYGKWVSVYGDFDNNERIQHNIYNQYYINDYEIVFDNNITKKIEVNLQNKTAFCDFIYTYKQKDTVDMRVDYWLNSGQIFAKCHTLTGTNLFCVNINYVEDEFRLLFEGYYNRQIYSSDNERLNN